MAAPQASCPTSTATSLSFPDRPSRILTDLLNDPQPNSPSHLLILSLTALDDLNDKYAHLKAIHGGTRITYLAARHIFNEILAEFNQCKDAPEPVVRAVNTANAACEKVEREMGIITKAMGKCEKESMVLSGDVAFLKELMQEMQKKQGAGEQGVEAEAAENGRGRQWWEL